MKQRHMKLPASSQRGFTLIELSIVLVIIGLIVGGVLVGQDLIRASKINAVISEITKTETMVNVFRLKYNQLPGDFNKASQFFGTACTTPVNNCNGDGNRVVDYTEGKQVWAHLGLAGISNKYSWTSSTYLVGENYFESKYGQGVGISYLQLFFPVYGRQEVSILLSKTPAANTINPVGSAFAAMDAYNIDKKMDDGLADSGRIYAIIGMDPDGNWDTSDRCVSGSHAATSSSYNLDETEIGCMLAYWQK